MQKVAYEAKLPDANGVIAYDEIENETWAILCDRQYPIVKRYACDEYLKGLSLLNLTQDRIPQCKEVSTILHDLTGWGVHPVKALISFTEFYQLLSNKRFPAASFIRRREELDYLQEPDIFHEIIGHCPLLTDPTFADFSQAFGELGLRTPKEYRAVLQRLYWFTVEFGLIRTAKGLRAYGGGILSSKSETIYSIESEMPVRESFDLLTILRTPYRYDMIQKNYFVIETFNDFYRCMQYDLLDAVKEAIHLGDNITAATEANEQRSC